jgi:hypothetical protein
MGLSGYNSKFKRPTDSLSLSFSADHVAASSRVYMKGFPESDISEQAPIDLAWFDSPRIRGFTS